MRIRGNRDSINSQAKGIFYSIYTFEVRVLLKLPIMVIKIIIKHKNCLLMQEG